MCGQGQKTLLAEPLVQMGDAQSQVDLMCHRHSSPSVLQTSSLYQSNVNFSLTLIMML